MQGYKMLMEGNYITTGHRSESPDPDAKPTKPKPQTMKIQKVECPNTQTL